MSFGGVEGFAGPSGIAPELDHWFSQIKAQMEAAFTAAEDLDFAGGSGTGSVDLDTQTFTIAGTANEIDTSASGQTLTVGLPASVTITTLLTAPTLDATNLEVTNLKAKDGTAAGSIANSTGVVTLASSVLTTTDINGGTIDGAVIGGASAAAITGTTITASTAFVPNAADGASLGTASLEFSDLYLADGAVIRFGHDQDVSLTHVPDSGLLLSGTRQLQFHDASQRIAASSDTVMTIAATDEIGLTSTLIDVDGNIDVSGTIVGASTISAGTAFIPDAADGASLGTDALEFSDLYLADGAQIAFGDDQEVTLTHVADTGLLLSDASGIGTTQLQFGDSGTYIHQSADGVLDLVSDTEIEINATDIDINGAVNISGATVLAASLNIAGDGATVTGIKDEDDLGGGSSSATKLATQQSIKAYVDSVTPAAITASTGLKKVSNDIRVNYDDSGNIVDAAAAIAGGDEVAATDLIIIGDDSLTNNAVRKVVIGDINVGIFDNDQGYGRLGSNETVTGTWSFSTTVTANNALALQNEGSDFAGVSGYQSIWAYNNGSTTELRTRLSSSTVMNIPIVTGSAANDQLLVSTGTDHEADWSGTGLTWNGSTLSATNFSGNGSNLTSISASLTTVTNLGAGSNTYYPAMANGSSGGVSMVVDTDKLSYTQSTYTLNVDNLDVDGTASIDALDMPDAAKIRLGTGNDLELYHSGSHSFIGEAGTGDLFIYGQNNIYLANDSSGTENYLAATKDGAVTLYYDNGAKLATVTGGVNVSGDLQVNGYRAIKQDRYGYSASYRGIIVGQAGTTNISLGVDISAVSGSSFSSGGQVVVPAGGIALVNNAGGNFIGLMRRQASSDNIIIGPAMSSGMSSGPLTLTTTSLGVGTAPSAPLHVYSSTEHMFKLDTPSSSGSPYMSWNSAGTRRAYIQFYDTSGAMIYWNHSNEHWFGSGNVYRMHIRGTSDHTGRIQITNTQAYVEENPTQLEDNVGGTTTVDWMTGNQQLIDFDTTFGGSQTQTINIGSASMYAGGGYTLLLQYNSGTPPTSGNITWTSATPLLWVNGTPPTIAYATAGDITVVQFMKTESSTDKVIGSWYQVT